MELKNTDINHQNGRGKNIIIHISGFPGSGKTTLGEKLQKMFNNIIVYDTDEFIQPHTKEGKKLLKLDNGKKSKEYKILWEKTIENKINILTSKYKNKIIVFVGSLDNFAPPNTIYNIKADYKFILNVPLNELLKRYYLRIYFMDQKITKEKSINYWKKLSKGVYRIHGSEDIIKDYEEYNEWHKKNNYIFLTDYKIIDKINNIINS